MIWLSGDQLSTADVHAIAAGAPVALAPEAAARMAANVAATPAGPSVLESKRALLVGEHAVGMAPATLSRAFIQGHCAGVGAALPVAVVRAAMAARANVLAVGHSGCRPQAAQVFVDMLNGGIHPVVPSQGSVGAAGDLAPMAHIARVACGYDEVPRTGFAPLEPTPKEALALINGISLTTGIAALAVERAQRLLSAAVMACAMTMEAVGADAGCIDPRPLAARRHPGGIAVGASLRRLLAQSTMVTTGRRPDAFSIRCAPAVLGTVQEAVAHVSAIVARELNAAGDNPLLFAGEGGTDWVEAGNFHGAPVALAMDHLRAALAQLGTLSERRTYRLSYGQLTPGLPSFLVEGTGLNSGFMLAQYTAASLASELKGLAHPASVDTIPTVQHHEDHVSMGPIAARMALESLECAADIVGIEALLAAQALDLRRRGFAVDAAGKRKKAAPVVLAPAMEDARARVREVVDFWEDDGLLHPDLAAAGALVRGGRLVPTEATPTPW